MSKRKLLKEDKKEEEEEEEPVKVGMETEDSNVKEEDKKEIVKIEEPTEESEEETEEEETEKEETEVDDKDIEDAEKCLSKEEVETFRALKEKIKNYRKETEKSVNELSPNESAEENYADENTISPGKQKRGQDVFKPSSSVHVSREQEFPASKRVQESPLFIGLLKELEEMKKSFNAKLDSLDKSSNARLDNIKKNLEKFYGSSFYKALGENVSPEGVQQLPISKQLEMGERIKFRNK